MCLLQTYTKILPPNKLRGIFRIFFSLENIVSLSINGLFQLEEQTKLTDIQEEGIRMSIIRFFLKALVENYNLYSERTK